jgi:sulfotransferase
MFANYYQDHAPVCFNTNRGWNSLTPLIAELFPSSKIIVCIREIPWILDSFEQLISKNPLSQTNMFSQEDGASVYSRTRSLLREDRTLGFAYNSFKQALFGNQRHRLCVVEYDALARDPRNTMKKIYGFLDQPLFDHDFENVSYSNDEFDSDVGLKGLHTVRSRVEFRSRRPILPTDLWNEYQPLSFWKQNHAQVSQGVNWIK